MLGRKNPQYETLTEVNTSAGKVRIWRTAKTLDEAKSFHHAAMQANIRSITDRMPREQWEATLMRMPNVACVAIVDADGNGVSIYPDWH